MPEKNIKESTTSVRRDGKIVEVFMQRVCCMATMAYACVVLSSRRREWQWQIHTKVFYFSNKQRKMCVLQRQRRMSK